MAELGSNQGLQEIHQILPLFYTTPSQLASKYSKNGAMPKIAACEQGQAGLQMCSSNSLKLD